MADSVLFISWGAPARGREERGLEVFNEAVGMYGRMQQDGRIESFDVVLLGPNPGLNGYIEVKGSADQLTAIKADEEFERNLIDAALIVDDFQLSEGVCDEGIARQMEMYREALTKVPQTA